MRYEGDIYRPPSEAYSYLLQVTIGCAHNKCTFCTMFKDKQFRVRPMVEILEDIQMARAAYRHIEKIFLCDGDALCLTNDKLITILKTLKTTFPECKRVSIYGSAKDILRKTDKELRELVENGLTMVYIGGESGSDKILKMIKKDITAKELIQAVNKAENAGMKTSVTFISGMGGKEHWEEHAVETGKAIKEMNSSYSSLLTLMLDPRAEIYEDINSGKFKLLTAQEVLEETYLMLQYAKPEKTCIFRSNHASNYVSLKGNLPQDNERLMALLQQAMEDHGLIKAEAFRRL